MPRAARRASTPTASASRAITRWPSSAPSVGRDVRLPGLRSQGRRPQALPRPPHPQARASVSRTRFDVDGSGKYRLAWFDDGRAVDRDKLVIRERAVFVGRRLAQRGHEALPARRAAGLEGRASRSRSRATRRGRRRSCAGAAASPAAIVFALGTNDDPHSVLRLSQRVRGACGSPARPDAWSSPTSSARRSAARATRATTTRSPRSARHHEEPPRRRLGRAGRAQPRLARRDGVARQRGRLSRPRQRDRETGRALLRAGDAMNETLKLTPSESVTIVETAAERSRWRSSTGPAASRRRSTRTRPRTSTSGSSRAALRVRVGESERELAAGEEIEIPAGAAHQMWNPGADAGPGELGDAPGGRTEQLVSRRRRRRRRRGWGATGCRARSRSAVLLSEYGDMFRLAVGPAPCCGGPWRRSAPSGARAATRRRLRA